MVSYSNTRLTVIIPTKNRPDALERMVRSVLEQTHFPSELIIMDQSAGTDSRSRVEAMRPPNLKYIHDPLVHGVSAARNRAMDAADDGIWLFLDDDETLEVDFIEHILAVYRDYPEVSGVAGIITNYVRSGPQFCTRIFVRGPFHDERQPIYWNAESFRASQPLVVRWFPGGAMSFPSSVIGRTRFDENLRTAEDVDFCLRVQAKRLVIAPLARFRHVPSPIGRLTHHWVRQHVHDHLLLYRRHFSKHRIAYLWLLCGYAAVIAAGCLRRFSMEPIRAFRSGIEDVRGALRRI